MKYSEKLKDPRWQKKRLEILERDEWTCQSCFDSESTLHVHHKNYLKGKDPWQYENDNFITLCESCHEYEKENRYALEQSILKLFKDLFLVDSFFDVYDGFCHLDVHSQDVTSSMLNWFLKNDDLQKEMIQRYFNYLRECNQIDPRCFVNKMKRVELALGE